MGKASVPVNLFNPGQVFACLGFLEAADILLGDAEGHFDWENDAKFVMSADGKKNPFEVVLEFLAKAKIEEYVPVRGDQSNFFPAAEDVEKARPIRLYRDKDLIIELSRWIDGSSRDNFKLYLGNRSAFKIAQDMLRGGEKKKKKTKGICKLWQESGAQLIRQPFRVTPMGGSFNLDPRGTWTAIDTGYSPDKQGQLVEASPVVEFLATWGLEHARPRKYADQFHYVVWGVDLPPILARATITGAIPSMPVKYFHFKLGYSGKEKIVTFAQQELDYEQRTSHSRF